MTPAPSTNREPGITPYVRQTTNTYNMKLPDILPEVKSPKSFVSRKRRKGETHHHHRARMISAAIRKTRPIPEPTMEEKLLGLFRRTLLKK